MSTENDDEDIISETIPSDDPPASVTGDEDALVTSLGTEDESKVSPEEDQEEVDDGGFSPNGEIKYPEDKIDLRGEGVEELFELLKLDERKIGAAELDRRVRTIGSWENLVYRSLRDPNNEERRAQEALGLIVAHDRDKLYHLLKNEQGKVILKTAPIVSRLKQGETKSFTGDAALAAFEFQESGGGYRLCLYNSGIAIDILTPVGNDIQTMIANCLILDQQLGATQGAHYFTYDDLMYKTQIINFLQPLIVNSTFGEYDKKEQLWSVVKITDLSAIVATLAAICYRDGFDGFMTRCSNPGTKENPNPCHHTETFKADIFKMIVTRFSAMSTDSINHMVETRSPNMKHNLAKIAEYQAGLGLEGEVITFDNTSFTMKIPSVMEYLEAGSKFTADIINEIEGDNNAGRYEQFGLRYIRTFLPWIASVSKTGSIDDTVVTSEPKVIIRQLEKLEDTHGEKLIDALRHYVAKAQLTYVGFPATECPICKHIPVTPSGMMTLDPFTTFFTLAFLYLRKPSSTDQTA